MTPNNYDFIAPFYDLLTRLIFKKNLYKSKICWLNEIQPENTILIIGGGTGEVLKVFETYNIDQFNITYLDKSLKMMQKARQSVHPDLLPHIEFINEDLLAYQPVITYDVIVTNFFLDQFDPTNLRKVMVHINSLISRTGMWIYTDFDLTDEKVNSFWSGLFIKIMYIFFKLTTNISASQLPDAQEIFADLGYKIEKEKRFIKNMVTSKVLKKGKKIEASR